MNRRLSLRFNEGREKAIGFDITDKTIGIKVCSALFAVGGLMQFIAMVTDSMLL
jgi:hypothetical protein